jgi:hypothetical protein
MVRKPALLFVQQMVDFDGGRRSFPSRFGRTITLLGMSLLTQYRYLIAFL